MTEVVGIKFKTSGRIYYFDPVGLEIHKGDGVIVETARGLEYGEVASAPHAVEENEIVTPLKPVTRVATEDDRRMRDEHAAKEADAFAVCQEKISKHGLDMTLVDVEYTFNGSKIVFYFTADERVDFRDLVKDLAYVFRTRIELRQIGVRDEAKMLGGLGSCGRPVCCKSFLDDFRPVSIKMAKEQNLSLSPTKISGLCGRLMCCLQYEQAAYESMRKQMPRVGKTVTTLDGNGVVVENNVITERTRVRLTLPDGTVEMRTYPFKHIAPEGEPVPACAAEARREQEAADAENLSVRPTPRPRPQQNRNGSQQERPARRDDRPRQGRQQQGTRPQGDGQPGGSRQPGGRPQQQGNRQQQSARPQSNGNRQQGGGQQPVPNANPAEGQIAPDGQPKKKRRPHHRRGKGGGGNGGQGGGNAPKPTPAQD